MPDATTITAPASNSAQRTWLMPLILYSVAHFLVDLYQASLGILQPALQDRYGLSLTQAGILAGVFVCSGSMMQPLYGYLCDRFRSRLFSAIGPALAALFISCIGLARGFGSLLLMVILGGVGVAAFHPQAASNAVASITKHRGRAMATFISSGSIGLAAGPALFSPLLASGGLDRARMGAIPGVLITLLLLFFLPPLSGTRSSQQFDWAPMKVVWKPMTVLFLLVLIRSIVQITFTQMLPLYLRTERHYTLSQASLSLSLYLLSGAIGGFAGGNLADRFGGRLIILISMIGSVPFLALFVFGHGAWSAIGLVLGGLILLFTMPVNIVIAQQLVPSQAGVVSALMMGFAWGTAGLIFIPLTGWVSDLFSMQVAFSGLIMFPVLGFFLGLKLPRKLSV